MKSKSNSNGKQVSRKINSFFTLRFHSIPITHSLIHFNFDFFLSPYLNTAIDKVLSVRQPWAWLLVNGYKTIESRTWSLNYRGRLWIQAAKKEPTSVDIATARKFYPGNIYLNFLIC